MSVTEALEEPRTSVEEAVLMDVASALQAGTVVPYLGPEALLLAAANLQIPSNPAALAERLTRRVAVPSRIRRNLTAAAQYIENFRHRKVLRKLMLEAFALPARPAPLHLLLARLRKLPLLVDIGYDAASAIAFAGRADWGQVQGVSQAEQCGRWWACYDAGGTQVTDELADTWATLVYKPLGSVSPAGNFLVSDSDLVEVLTEIDIQTPIPPGVRDRRSGRSFLFLGCRFNDQVARAYARQIMKRSSARHWAVFAHQPTRNEQRFFAEQSITVLPLSLGHFVDRLASLVAH
jgi:hypothetical protein